MIAYFTRTRLQQVSRQSSQILVFGKARQQLFVATAWLQLYIWKASLQLNF